MQKLEFQKCKLLLDFDSEGFCDLAADINVKYIRLSGSIWQRCTMPGIFVDIYFLKASILSY